MRKAIEKHRSHGASQLIYILDLPVVFSEAHGKRIQVFVDLVQGRDGLDNVVVLLLHAELDLSARVGMA
jgi:hypothetical protein